MAENKDGQQKSEPASAKRLSEARARGQVSKSMDLTTAGILLVGTLMVYLLGSPMMTEIRNLLKQFLMDSNTIQITEQNFMHYYTDLLLFLAKILLPILLLIFVIVLATEIGQVGLKFSEKKFTEGLNWKQMANPFSGIKKTMLSGRTVFELMKSIAKLLILGFVTYQVIASHTEETVALIERPYTDIGVFMVSISMEMIMKVAFIFVIIAVGDMIYQKHRFKEDMKMTKQEVKEETKQTEGDPQIRARIRSLMRNRIKRLMMKNVKNADVVITNPTHFAVALKYDQGKSSAPVLLAKGLDYIAQQIKEIAKENNIPIVEDPPLARAIYFNTETDREIPENLFKAVAQVLAYVYHLKKNVK
jgi:flagellar biosynthetic protein FlhB